MSTSPTASKPPGVKPHTRAICFSFTASLLELLDEAEMSNQGLNYLGFYPSEPCMVKMLTRSGFPFVYEFLTLPPNPLYGDTSQRRRLRTMMLASHFELPSTMLRLSRDQKRPVEELADPWVKPSRRIWSRLGRAYTAFFAR